MTIVKLANNFYHTYIFVCIITIATIYLRLSKLEYTSKKIEVSAGNVKITVPILVNK